MQLTKILLFFIVPFYLFACDMQKYPESGNDNCREILIYSGMTMIQPLKELSALVEAGEDCRIIITAGGSGHLLRSVEINQIGDLFFPGDKSYIDTLKQKGIISDSVQVGYNQARLFVQPGNPKQINSDLNNFQNKQLHVVFGSQKAGAIGRETERIFRKYGF